MLNYLHTTRPVPIEGSKDGGKRFKKSKWLIQSKAEKGKVIVVVTKKDGTDEEWSDTHAKLVYLISKYSHTSVDEKDNDRWIKELPLLALIHKGIIDGTFDYDYAPVSFELQTGRIFLNLSQEGIDNIEDLREFGFVDCMKLSSMSHLYLNAYKINSNGMKIIDGIHPEATLSEKQKEDVNTLCSCPKCKHLLHVNVDLFGHENELELKLICSNANCDYKALSNMTDIEDVSYSTEPYLPKFPRIL